MGPPRYKLVARRRRDHHSAPPRRARRGSHASRLSSLVSRLSTLDSRLSSRRSSLVARRSSRLSLSASASASAAPRRLRVTARAHHGGDDPRPDASPRFSSEIDRLRFLYDSQVGERSEPDAHEMYCGYAGPMTWSVVLRCAPSVFFLLLLPGPQRCLTSRSAFALPAGRAVYNYKARARGRLGVCRSRFLSPTRPQRRV